MTSNQKLLELAQTTLLLARDAKLPTGNLTAAMVEMMAATITNSGTKECRDKLANEILNVIQYFRDEFESVINKGEQ